MLHSTLPALRLLHQSFGFEYRFFSDSKTEVYPSLATLFHLTFWLHIYYIMVTQKVKCYFKKKSNQYRGVFHAVPSKSKRVSLRSPFSHLHLNTGKPFSALGLRSPDEPPEPLPFEPPELFLASFAAAAAACAAEIVAEVPSP